MNHIIGKLTSDEMLDGIELLKKYGYKLRYTKLNADAIRAMDNGVDKNMTTGYFDGYIRYKHGNAEYKDHEIVTLLEFRKRMSTVKPNSNSLTNVVVMSNGVCESLPNKSNYPVWDSTATEPKYDWRSPLGVLPDEEILPTKHEDVMQDNEVEEGKYIRIEKDRVLNCYKQSSAELKDFLRLLFGAELFQVKTYKVGDKFEGMNDVWVLIQVNSNVVTLIDSKYKNFGVSKQVKDVDHVTEEEFRSLVSYNYDRFKRISK